MTADEALSSIRFVLNESLGVPGDDVVPSANLREDLELDSLDMAELLAHLEDQLHRTIDTELIMDVQTVDDVVRLVCGLSERTRS